MECRNTYRIIPDYQPIIEAVERGESIDENHPAVIQLEEECISKFGKDKYVCLLGANKLAVAEVSGRVRIKEYDGRESYEEEFSYDDWL